MNGVVIDTNVFVAAGFNTRSTSARIVAAVREGHFLLAGTSRPATRPRQSCAGFRASIGRRSRIYSGQRVSLPVTLIQTLLS